MSSKSQINNYQNAIFDEMRSNPDSPKYFGPVEIANPSRMKMGSANRYSRNRRHRKGKTTDKLMNMDNSDTFIHGGTLFA